MATKKAEKAEYTDPPTKTNLQEFFDREDGKEPEAAEGRVFQELDDDDKEAFVGVDPMYQNYANDNGKPRLPEEGPEAENFKRVKASREADEEAVERQRKAEEERSKKQFEEPTPAPEPQTPPPPPGDDNS